MPNFSSDRNESCRQWVAGNVLPFCLGFWIDFTQCCTNFCFTDIYPFDLKFNSFVICTTFRGKNLNYLNSNHLNFMLVLVLCLLELKYHYHVPISNSTRISLNICTIPGQLGLLFRHNKKPFVICLPWNKDVVTVIVIINRFYLTHPLCMVLCSNITFTQYLHRDT